VLIPKIVETVHYITQEMDEQSREEFFRVKKVVEKKKQRLAAEKIAQKNAELLAAEDDGESDEDIFVFSWGTGGGPLLRFNPFFDYLR